MLSRKSENDYALDSQDVFQTSVSASIVKVKHSVVLVDLRVERSPLVYDSVNTMFTARVRETIP